MRTMGIVAVYPKKNLSQANQAHRVYPYLLRNLNINHPNQVWAIEEKVLRKIQRNSRKEPAEPICSFCGKSESEIKKLIDEGIGIHCNQP